MAGPELCCARAPARSPCAGLVRGHCVPLQDSVRAGRALAWGGSLPLPETGSRGQHSLISRCQTLESSRAECVSLAADFFHTK